jgi:hypothetical protein
MKIFLTLLSLVLFVSTKSQQSFRINDFPRVFHGAIPNTFDKKINDTLTLHGVYKKPNYEISLVKTNGSLLCSCLYKVSPNVETNSGRDSTVEIKVLEPVSDNCVKRYRNLVDRKLQ